MRTNSKKFSKLKYLIYLIMMILSFSCAKDGSIGPKGEQGESGERGEHGIKGKDGNFLFSGTLDPSISIGKIGDFYLNKKTSVLFGPKKETGWGQSYDLKGQDGNNGEAGTDGAVILSGENTPNINIGKVGDFYFDIRKMEFYGPKVKKIDSNGESKYDWGLPINIEFGNLSNIILKGLHPEFRYDISLIGNEIEATSQQGTLSLSNMIDPNESIDNIFMEFYYTIEHANISYPLRSLERKWSKIGFETVDLEDIKISSTQSLKNVKLKLMIEKINRPNSVGYWYSFKLNATVPTPDYNTIYGSFIKILVKIHKVSPVQIGKNNLLKEDIQGIKQ